MAPFGLLWAQGCELGEKETGWKGAEKALHPLWPVRLSGHLQLVGLGLEALLCAQHPVGSLHSPC